MQMTTRFFSTRKRAPFLGPYPLERMVRGPRPDLSAVPRTPEISFRRPEDPASIVNAMRDHQAMMDAIRDGLVNPSTAQCPADPAERAQHLKSFGYFCDAAAVGIGPLPSTAHLETARVNPDVATLAQELKTRQLNTLASGIDQTMADLREAMAAPPGSVADHAHVVVLLYAMPRDPRPDEPGVDWLKDAQAHRACVLATETAVVLANYIRLLGWDAKAHTPTSTDIDLNQAVVASGLACLENGRLVHPYLGTRFGAAVVSTTFHVAHDEPLAPLSTQKSNRIHGPAWWVGWGTVKSAFNQDAFAKRDFVLGPHPFETLRRVDNPTTYIDRDHVPRVPKRTDMFARAQFGDLGKPVQAASSGGHYVRKSAPSAAQRRILAAFALLQDGPAGDGPRPTDAARNAANLKATSYFLGIDAVGLSACPDWTWYSHDATGTPVTPPHDQAISMIVDQGFETMEGASGDDWISVAQSMRAYLRFSLLGGVIARQIRNLGYRAKAHTAMDGDVLPPPLLLLSGLGEVSRIGEVILNPFLGPRLKSGVVTTDMPITHDKPIDFGLQRFCESCNKCARECPSGAITAGPKRMFNGYEIWKSDSQKCATYRITTPGGAMCGRCMKTCPWNLEGLFAEKPFRWAAMHVPKAAPLLARLDDALGHGSLNPVKKWWWDIELTEAGGYRPTGAKVNARDLQKDLRLRFEDQTLAVYPAPLAPPPWPYPFAMDREAGIAAYQSMVSAESYKKRRAAGQTGPWDHRYANAAESPVLQMEIESVNRLTDTITHYVLRAADGSALPEWEAGAHVDVVISPDKIRQYSLMGNPGDRHRYEIAVLRETDGSGGSVLLHRIFTMGRKLFVSRPINHFALEASAQHSILMGGGIGLTPMLAMAHSLYGNGRSFDLHYSVSTRASAAFAPLMQNVAWLDRMHLHISDEGTRADFDRILKPHGRGTFVYACGPEAYLSSVLDAAKRAGIPKDARRVEYFSVPDRPDLENHPFVVALKDGRRISVRSDQSAAEALLAEGIAIDLKCADGLCGVCRCGVLAGDVEHRDFVLSKAQRRDSMILCQSRAAEKDGTLYVDL
jgi:reductive dehalogenase